MAQGRDQSRSPSSMSLRQQFAEAATSHPLESSTSKSESLSPPPAPAQPPGTSPNSSAAPYAVYHRPSGSRSSLNLTGAVPSPPVSSPTVSSMASSRAGPESATSKLQFQTLQGQVQSAGIKSESLGWAFLLSLVHNEPALKSSLKGKERDNELSTWQRIVDVLQDPNQSLKEDLDLVVLLPKAAKDKFSVAAFASHVFLAKPLRGSPAGSAAHTSDKSSYRHVVSLSGLRGCIQGDQLTFTGYAPGFPSPLPELDLQSETFLSALFGPDPYILSEGNPSITIDELDTALSVPRQPPPQPANKPESSTAKAKAAGSAATSRLASLFGGTGASGSYHRHSSSQSSSSSASQSYLPPVATTPDLTGRLGFFGGQAATQANANAAAAPAPQQQPETLTLPPLSLNVAITEDVVSWSTIASAITQNTASTMRTKLTSAFESKGLTQRIANTDEAIERITTFLRRLAPPLHLSSTYTSAGSASSGWDWLPPSPTKLRAKDAEKCDLSLFADPSGQISADAISDAVQDLYEIIRQILRPTVVDDAEKAAGALDFEDAVDEVTEVVEASLCNLIYEKIFSIQCAGDVADDDTLTSRIAALGLLQLSLTHLGLDINPDETETDEFEPDRPVRSMKELQTLQTGLDQLVKVCRKELKKLSEPDRRSPLAKLDVLIQTHKILVDRLSELPPVPMRQESTAADNASISSRPRGAELEMTDDAKSLGRRSRATSRASYSSSLHPEAKENVERTPRPGSMERSPSHENLPEIKLSDAALPTEGAAPQERAQEEEDEGNKPRGSGRKGSSADVILPLLIYSVVQANPQQLASNLAFIQRFRAESLQAGESMYCLVNFQAVVEFLLNVNVESLGLDSDKILDSETPTGPLSEGGSSSRAPSVRLKVSSEIDNIAGHVSSTIHGMTDMVGFFLTKTATTAPGKTLEDVRTVLSASDRPAHMSTPETNDAKESISAGFLRRARERSKSVASTLSRQEPDPQQQQRELQDVTVTEEEQQPVLPTEPSLSTSPDPSKSSLSNRLASFARFQPQAASTPADSSSNNNNNKLPVGGHRPSAQSIFASLSSPAASLRSGASSLYEAPTSPPPAAQHPTSVAAEEPQRGQEGESGGMTRFMNATSAMELQLSEVQVLLDDYKRLARLVGQ